MKRILGWLCVAVLLLSPALWLGWRNWDRIERLAGESPAPPPAETPTAPPEITRVTALGRIEPGNGLIRVAGPARFAVVVSEVLVAAGDRVHAGQEIAVLESAGVEEATVTRLAAELEQADRDLKRTEALRADDVAAAAELDRVRTARDVAEGRLLEAQAELERSHVRAPVDGLVVDVIAQPGERVGPDGIVEIADTSAVYAVAEVYETDVQRIRRGQRATVASPALGAKPLTGRVEHVGLKVSRKDVLSTDPVADADQRVVEVRVRLDQPRRAERLTNLRVEVAIDLGA